MERLTNSDKEIPTLVDNAEYWLQVYFKLKDYEDLEERLNKIYGDCDGLLESIVELLEEHSGVDIPDDIVKVLLITNESVDFYKKCKSLEEQDRLIKLPCKVGDVVWNYSYFGLRDYKVTYMGFDKDGLLYFDCESGIAYSFRCYLKDFKDKIFLTKSEAEARLKELRGEENGSME